MGGSTIRDVARRAGVSTATVSRLINGSGPVGAATAARVRDAIDALDFRLNGVGRSLKTAHTRTLGVVIPSMTNPVFADAVAGIDEAARAAGYALMFTSTEYDPAREQEAVASLLGNRVDGLILTVADPARSAVLDRLDAAGTPYVLTYNQPGAHGRPTVTVDNVAAGRAVASHLAALGHARLAMVSGRFRASDRAVARQEGFRAGAAAHGLARPATAEMSFLETDAASVLRPLFADPATAPTALFCSNDLLAIAVIGALGRLGLAVPGAVSVVGFDGIAIGTHLHPTLATVVQPSREMGRAATRQLLGRLAGQSAPESVLLPHRLREGESAGQAARPHPADLQDLHSARKERAR